jgi:hypothetical protein
MQFLLYAADGNVAKRMTTQAAIFNLGVWEQTTATVQQPKEKIMASRTYKSKNFDPMTTFPITDPYTYNLDTRVRLS